MISRLRSLAELTVASRFSQDVTTNPNLSGNDYLQMAGVFHAVHEIARDVSPVRPSQSSGILEMECEHFNLRCLQTLTGALPRPGVMVF